MTKFKDSQIHGIPLWQSKKMRQVIIARWQETWTVVETRNQTKKTLSSR